MISSYISCNFRNNIIATISTSSFWIDDISMLRLEQYRVWVHLLCVVGAAAVYSRANHNHDLHTSMHRQALMCKNFFYRYNVVQGHSISILLFSTCCTEHVTHILWLLYYHVNRILRLLMLVEVMQSHLPIIKVSFWEGPVSISCYWHLMQDCSGTVGTEYSIIGYHICQSISCSSSSKSSSRFLRCYLTLRCVYLVTSCSGKNNSQGGVVSGVCDIELHGTAHD